MMQTALIVCNGTPPPLELLDRLWQQVDLKIGVDGGANFLIKRGQVPHYIIGDLDSLSTKTQSQIDPRTLIHIEEQSTNDADKAVRFCLEKQVQVVHMLGADGGRMDHCLTNLEVMYKYKDRLKLMMWTQLERIEIIQSFWSGPLRVGTTVSLIPLFGGVYGITTQGLKYALTKGALIPGQPPMGVSNQVVAASVSINIEAGALLLIIQNPT